jgi:lipoyl(octanoyl) transferase
MPSRLLEVRRLGVLPFREAESLQQKLVIERQQGRVSDLLLMLEHPKVITLGVSGDRGNVLASEKTLLEQGIKVHQTRRGGDVTYHGPGQLIGYPILSLKPDRCDLHRYVRDLEEVMIRTVNDFGVRAMRIPGLTGVWVGERKLAAVGVRVSRWVTSHGFAMNITTDLDDFSLIRPCGISDKGVTSLAQLADDDVSSVRVADSLVRHFSDVFSFQVTSSS